MPTGKIKYYNQDKGYGFIAQDKGEDLFFHILKSPFLEEIKAGQRVKYEITRGKKGLEAENIQLIFTPFEQRKLSQGKVVVSKDTLVWAPATDVRSRTRQPEQRQSAKLKAVKFCPHCNRIMGNYKEHLKLFHKKRRSEDALNRPSTIWGGHWESNRRRH